MIALKVISPSTSPISPSAELLSIASSVPIGQSGLVHVWGKNDMATHQMVGMFWVVTDPDGLLVEEYGPTWEGMAAGEEDDFIGGRFDLNKEGTYTIDVKLFMNPDNPVVVDSYEGDLCTVTTEVPPEYELIYQHEYPRGKTYVGKGEECTSTFNVPLPDQLFPNSWVIEKIANTFEEGVQEHDAEMLNIKIYEDATPTWHTDYKIVATSTKSPVPWAIIIPLVLAIILVVVIRNLIVEVKDIDWGKIPLWPLAIIGGIVVVGGGAALVLTAKKKK